MCDRFDVDCFEFMTLLLEKLGEKAGLRALLQIPYHYCMKVVATRECDLVFAVWVGDEGSSRQR